MKSRGDQALKDPWASRYKSVRLGLIRQIPEAAGRFRILLDGHEVLADAFPHKFPVRRLLKRSFRVAISRLIVAPDIRGPSGRVGRIGSARRSPR
jgi:hypothetical protein